MENVLNFKWRKGIASAMVEQWGSVVLNCR